MFWKPTCVRTAVLCVWLSAISGFAFADEEKARKHFENGLVLLETEDFAGAAAEFEVSVSLLPTKNGFFNLANCYKALHRYGDALNAIKRLQEQFGKSLDKAWKKEIETFKGSIENLVASLVVQVDHDGATISVDGTALGTSPLSEALVLGPGEHKVSVTKEGFGTQTRSVTLVSGKKIVETFQLAAQPATLSIKSNVTGAAVTIDGQPAGVTPMSGHQLTPGSHTLKVEHPGYEPHEAIITAVSGKPLLQDLNLVAIPGASQSAETKTDGTEKKVEKDKEKEVADTKKKKPIGAIVSLAVGGAVGIGAIVTGVLHLNKTNKIQETCVGNTCPVAQKKAGDTAHALAVATNVLIPVAATGIVLGTVLLFVTGRDRSEKEKPKVSFTPTAAPGAAGISISGRF